MDPMRRKILATGAAMTATAAAPRVSVHRLGREKPVAMEAAMLAPNAEVSMFPWKEPKERIPLAVRQIHSFLRAHRPTSARGSRDSRTWALQGAFMNVMRIVAVACVLLVGSPLFAEEWTTYQNLGDRFRVTAPGQPAIEKIKWKSEYDSMFPETMYRWQDGPNRYTVSIVDYSDSEAIYAANHHSDSFQLSVYWQIDILGSIQYAATQYRQKPNVKVTFDAFHYINLVTGHQLQLTNPDQSRTYVGIYLHENHLYIFDATVAKGMPPPLIFQQSPEFLDTDGNSIRYRTYYFNPVPEPRLNAGRPARGAPPATRSEGAPAGGGGASQRGARPQ
jgi:hypothetical protein